MNTKEKIPTVSGDISKKFSVVFGGFRSDVPGVKDISFRSSKDLTWGEISDCLKDTETNPYFQTKKIKFSDYFHLDTAEAKAVYKNHTGWWIVGVEGKKRNDKDITARSCLMLDVDGVSSDEISDLWQLLEGVQYLAYTTMSYLPEDELHGERWRIILPLSRTITTREEYAQVHAWFEKQIPGLDSSCKNWSHLMFTPTVFSDRRSLYRYYDEEGGFVDVDSLLRGKEDKRGTLPQITDAVKSTIQDPRTIPGDIGLICRWMSLSEVIESHFSDIWEKESSGRYKYAAAGGSGGGVLLTLKNGVLSEWHEKDGTEALFFKSHHASDVLARGAMHVFNFVRAYWFHNSGSIKEVTDWFRTRYNYKELEKSHNVAVVPFKVPAFDIVQHDTSAPGGFRRFKLKANPELPVQSILPDKRRIFCLAIFCIRDTLQNTAQHLGCGTFPGFHLKPPEVKNNPAGILRDAILYLSDPVFHHIDCTSRGFVPPIPEPGTTPAGFLQPPGICIPV